MKERLAKIIAHRGYCSRRRAETLITAGEVRVNGDLWKSLSEKVDSTADIQIKGTSLPLKQAARLWIFYKPSFMICSHGDPQNRPTVFEYIKKNFPSLPRIISVGRLDYLSEGLLLLTTDSSLARYLELPENKVNRQYDIKTQRPLSSAAIHQLDQGITIDEVFYESVSITPLKTEKNVCWYRFVLQEGKNREIRRILKHFDIPLARLKRVSYGPYHIGSLKKGEIKEMPIHPSIPTHQKAL